MGSNTRFAKDPQAVLDYQIDWSAWLGVDTIASSTWTVPTGITKTLDTKTTTATTIWLSSGTAGLVYSVVNTIVTAGGRTQDQTIYISIEER